MAISNSASGFRPGVCTSTTRPTSPFNGQVIYETDTKQTLVWQGSAWVMLTDADTPPGLQLVKTQTIGSGVTSVTVTDCFSSEFQSYRIHIEVNDTNGTASNTLQLSGITGSNYFTGGSYGSWGGATQTGYGPSVMTSWIASANTLNGTNTQIVAEIHNPNIARRKHGTIFAQAGNGHLSMNVVCSSTSTATGFVLAKAGDTMTGGTIRVYGYRD